MSCSSSGKKNLLHSGFSQMYRSCQEKSALTQAFHWLHYLLCHGASSLSWSLIFIFPLPHLQVKVFPFTAIQIVKNYLVLLSSLVKITMTPYLTQIYALLMPKFFILVHELMCHLSDTYKKDELKCFRL